MSIGFYPRLAWTNIQKNTRLYLPSILAGMGLICVFYIIFTLAYDNRLGSVRGGTYLSSVMPIGIVVVGLLSFILILYINSFLMKQRSREFGLYNVLGMEKRHIGRILFWESAISFGFVLIGGLLWGILLYKLCALLICRILMVDSVLGFYHVSAYSIVPTVLFFAMVYLLTYLFNRIRISRMKPAELLMSVHTGEKEPRVKWLFLIVGLAALGSGYYISITTKQPLQAIELFFLAVILVIIGTYCLFLTGTIALLKLLKRNTHFYYQKRHMVAVSGLLYRMKQNAVGLASITILATMVLVMVSTTVSMYAGINDTIKRQYYHQISMSASYDVDGENVPIPLDDLKEIMQQCADQYGLELSYTEHQQYLNCAICRKGQAFLTNRSNSSLTSTDLVAEAWFMTEAEYERLTGESLSLKENELAYYGLPNNASSFPDTLMLGDTTYQCLPILSEYPVSMEEYAIVDCFGFVVKDETVLDQIDTLQKEAYGDYASEISEKLVLDFADEDQVADVYDDFYETMRAQVNQYVESVSDTDGSWGGWGMSVDSKWDTIEYLYGMYGTLLFLGLILSVIFLFATALIIYYKQISEGYEDRERFQIMQKIGMSDREGKAAIRSQILLVFFLPLAVSAMHIAFAFPILTRLLKVLFQSNQMLFLLCTLASLGIFALIYIIIYSLTAKVYYQIVSKKRAIA